MVQSNLLGSMQWLHHLHKLAQSFIKSIPKEVAQLLKLQLALFILSSLLLSIYLAPSFDACIYINKMFINIEDSSSFYL